MESELPLAAVPLVNHRRLGGAGEDEVLLTPSIKELHMGVPMPGVEGLVRVEAIAVPSINAGGAGLGAVCHYKVPLPIQLEGLHKVGLSHPSGINILDLYEALWVLFPPAIIKGKLFLI